VLSIGQDGARARVIVISVVPPIKLVAAAAGLQRRLSGAADQDIRLGPMTDSVRRANKNIIWADGIAVAAGAGEIQDVVPCRRRTSPAR